MKDLTKLLTLAVHQEITWSISYFYETLEQIERSEFETSFWEGEENWATILKNGSVIGYVWKKYPFIALQSDFLPSIKNLLNNYKFIVYLEVKSLNTEVLSYNKDLLRKYFNTKLQIVRPLTIEGLWFLTNSI